MASEPQHSKAVDVLQAARSMSWPALTDDGAFLTDPEQSPTSTSTEAAAPRVRRPQAALPVPLAAPNSTIIFDGNDARRILNMFLSRMAPPPPQRHPRADLSDAEMTESNAWTTIEDNRRPEEERR